MFYYFIIILILNVYEKIFGSMTGNCSQQEIFGCMAGNGSQQESNKFPDRKIFDKLTTKN